MHCAHNTHMHTHTHAHTHACTHTCMHTHAHAHTHACTHTHCMHTHTACTHAASSSEEEGEKQKHTAKKRRRNQNVEIDELSQLLPVARSYGTMMDKLSTLRMSSAYLKLNTFLTSGEQGGRRLSVYVREGG